jgi:hypothetical protein
VDVRMKDHPCHLALQTVPPVGASNDTILTVGVLTTEGGSV